MANETRYGIISDVHKDPRMVAFAIDILQNKLAIEKLVLNGDIGEIKNTLQESQDYVAVILEAAGKSGLETYVQPGSHETFGAFHPVLDHFKNKYKNLISTFDVPKVETNDHHLVFLPGSDFGRGEYTIGNNDNIPTGLYIPLNDGLMPYDKTAHRTLMQQGMFQGLMYYVNMNDLKKLVNDNSKTIVICHVPRKFDSVDYAVDMAYFGEKSNGSVIPGVVVEDMIRQKYGIVSQNYIRLIAAAAGISLKIENRGNEDLRKLYTELGITKAVSGHFHESGWRAHDENVNPVNQGVLVDELYWNTGQLDLGKTGILTVNGGKVSYQNVSLKDYKQ